MSALSDFYIIAIQETPNWDPDTLADNNIAEAFGLYLFKDQEATHICSLTPNSRAEFLHNEFIPIDDDLPCPIDDDLIYETSGAPSTT